MIAVPIPKFASIRPAGRGRPKPRFKSAVDCFPPPGMGGWNMWNRWMFLLQGFEDGSISSCKEKTYVMRCKNEELH